MTVSNRPAVERVRPPKAPYVVVNRLMRWMLSSPARATRLGQHLMLLHLTGRKTGRKMSFPVAYRQADGGRLLVLTNSPWRVNLRDRPQVEVTFLGSRRTAHAELVDDPDTVATVYRSLIEQAGHRNAGRRMGIRINVDRVPTHEELVAAAHREGLAAIYVDMAPAAG